MVGEIGESHSLWLYTLICMGQVRKPFSNDGSVQKAVKEDYKSSVPQIHRTVLPCQVKIILSGKNFFRSCENFVIFYYMYMLNHL